MFKSEADDTLNGAYMSERWIKGCRDALERLRRLSAKEDKDRLERVRSIKTSLVLMGRSLSGWTKWANDPSTMANFSDEELAEMEKHLSSITELFIKFDLKTTKMGQDKGLNKKAVQRSRIRFIV